jgi:ribosomal protein S18 acetylase RimI-like enzyme
MNFEIQTMTIEDYNDVHAFWSAQPGIGLNESDTRENIAVFLQRNLGLSIIVREKEQVIGAVLCGHDGRRGYLHHLAVAPEFRHQRLGSLLVERCLAALRELNILKCNIFVWSDNENGQKFWRAIGYVGRKDLLVMQRETAGVAV